GLRATAGRRNAPFERDALDVGDAGHGAFAFCRVGFDQLVGQVARAGRGNGQLGASHFRAVFGFPGRWRTEVSADLLAAAVIEDRFGADEYPFRFRGAVGFGFALVGQGESAGGQSQAGFSIHRNFSWRVFRSAARAAVCTTRQKIDWMQSLKIYFSSDESLGTQGRHNRLRSNSTPTTADR
nr:hypothetical protein [Tanacetum cinerariifolium]